MGKFKSALPGVLADQGNDLTPVMHRLLSSLFDNVRQLEGRIAQLSRAIEAVAGASDMARRRMTIPSIGPLAATALLAAASTGHQFRKGRDMVARLGLVRRERSTGGRTTLLGISKRGSPHLRTLLIHGSRCMLRFLNDPTTAISPRALEPKNRAHAHLVAVARAYKQTLIAWIVLTRSSCYQARPAD